MELLELLDQIQVRPKFSAVTTMETHDDLRFFRESQKVLSSNPRRCQHPCAPIFDN